MILLILCGCTICKYSHRILFLAMQPVPTLRHQNTMVENDTSDVAAQAERNT